MSHPEQPATALLRVNGLAVPCVSALDRGLHYGDGLFETIACVGGRPRFIRLHLDRLLLGCERLRIAPPARQTLDSEVRELAAGHERCIVKLIVTRGPTLARGYAIAAADETQRIAIRYPWTVELHDGCDAGVRVRSLSMRLGENPLLAGLKHLNRLEQILARAEWSDPDIAEGMLYDQSGRLVSATASNVFLVRAGAVLTPLVDRCGVAGVMRRVVLCAARRAGRAASEQALGKEDLDGADEVFLTSARFGIRPVRALDERPLAVGPVTRALQVMIAPALEEARDE